MLSTWEQATDLDHTTGHEEVSISNVSATRFDVGEALNWLFDKMNFMAIKSTEINDQKTESVRILHDYERMKIPAEAYGYILKLRSLSLINGAQMEKIIDYCMFTDSHKISESEINEIIAAIIFEDNME